MVYGSQRAGVSLYNRRTGQTSARRARRAGAARRRLQPQRAHDAAPVVARGPRDVLFYASNAVWKSTDRAHSWTRISPDLARQTWAVPASAGKYAGVVTPAPLGSDHGALAVAARHRVDLGGHRRRRSSR